MVLGVLGIFCAIDGLRARDPRKRYQGLPGFWRKHWDKFRRRDEPAGTPPNVTVLFPIFCPKHTKIAAERFEKITTGFTRQEILEEYRLQIHETGRILARKIRSNQRSIGFFYFQLAAYVLGGLAAYVSFWIRF